MIGFIGMGKNLNLPLIFNEKNENIYLALLFNSLGNLYRDKIDRKKQVSENIINNANRDGHLWKRYSFLLEEIKGMMKALLGFIEENWAELEKITVDDGDCQKLTLPYLHLLLLWPLFSEKPRPVV
ncbi:hypothetical protein FIV31_04895 [Coxiella endosymbiont of Ornithodoros amblus]|uniref:hypothetical protein n=1 Tax=Coxiella endosymbiont of Ornithodoros amblus TaxID=1656166 RepID=UPI00244DA104|nr:hypothetical protein [Coxiella endosymbiont of Ornithodoros amblus]MBW5802798.1 hypothetical protein [Coxiella endosymbiont of Ornithodoros amblus]